jgi:hypothetical protein
MRVEPPLRSRARSEASNYRRSSGLVIVEVEIAQITTEAEILRAAERICDLQNGYSGLP